MAKLPNHSNKNKLKIVAAIPCFNTQPFIKDVVLRTRKYVDLVIIIDDGSQDDTARVAREAGAQVKSHDQNRGYGEAIQSCFKAAKASAVDVLVILDGDGQHNPDEIPLLLEPVLRGEADLVIGSRFLGNTDNIPLYRKFGIKVITFLVNFGSRVKLSDGQSGFRAYSKRVLDAIFPAERGMSVSVEVLIKARAAGLKIKEVATLCRYHDRSSSKNPVAHGLSVALFVVRLRLMRLLNSLFNSLIKKGDAKKSVVEGIAKQ